MAKRILKKDVSYLQRIPNADAGYFDIWRIDCKGYPNGSYWDYKGPKPIKCFGALDAIETDKGIRFTIRFDSSTISLGIVDVILWIRPRVDIKKAKPLVVKAQMTKKQLTAKADLFKLLTSP